MAKVKKPEPRNRGQIIPRGDRKWLVRVFVGMKNGKRQYDSKVVHGTFKQADQQRTRMLREMDTQTYVSPAKQTVQAYLDDWLKTKTDISARTKLDYAARIDTDILPTLGHVQLDKLTPQAVQRVYADLQGEPRKLSARTVRYTHSILHQALEQAVAWNLLAKNPCAHVNLPRVQRTEMACLTPGETALIFEKTADHPWHALFRVLLTTGLRTQEVLALKWEDIELAGETPWLIVRRAVVKIEDDKYEVQDDMKTATSRRKLVLSPETHAALLRHKAKQAAEILAAGEKYVRNGFIFANSVGGFLDISKARRLWKAALKAAGITKHVRLYDTRHTHLTHLLSAGVNVKAVAARSGHSNTNTLLSTYAHVLPEVEQASATIIEDLLRVAAERTKLQQTGTN